MGGKNCVIVDADADLDDAVPALVDSAFVYAGQKCSAADRVLVHEAVAEALIERVAGAVATLEVGQADTFGTDVPPVIEREAQERVERFAAECAAQGAVIARQEEGVPGRGWFVPPTAAANLDPGSPVLREEVFGPLLTIEAVHDVEDALDRIDQLSYALTSGLFCRNPRTVEEVSRRNPVGNLYVNRRITGAMVGRQPFGGNRLSGTGTKAGGPDYLLHFVSPASSRRTRSATGSSWSDARNRSCRRVLVRQLGVERDREDPPLAHGDRMAVDLRQHLHVLARLETHGARMNTACTGSPNSSRSASNERTWRPKALRSVRTSRIPRWSRSSMIIPAQVPKIGLPNARSGSASPSRSTPSVIVVDSPPGMTRPSSPSRSAGTRTSRTSAPSARSTFTWASKPPWSARTPTSGAALTNRGSRGAARRRACATRATSSACRAPRRPRRPARGRGSAWSPRRSPARAAPGPRT